MPEFYDADGNPVDLSEVTESLKIDGEVVEMSYADIINKAQKAGAVERRMQELAAEKKELEEMKADNQSAIRFSQDFRNALNGDEDALRRVSDVAGWDFEAFQGAADQINNKAAGGAQSGNQSNNVQLPPEAQEAIDFVASLKKQGLNPRDISSALGQGYKNQTEAAAKGKLRQYLSEQSDLGKLGDDVLQEIVESARDMMRGRQPLNGQGFTDRDFQQAARDAAARAKKLGVGQKSPSESGIGGSSGIPNQTFTGHLPERPKKRPPVTAGVDHENYIANRLAEVQREKALGSESVEA